MGYVHRTGKLNISGGCVVCPVFACVRQTPSFDTHQTREQAMSGDINVVDVEQTICFFTTNTPTMTMMIMPRHLLLFSTLWLVLLHAFQKNDGSGVVVEALAAASAKTKKSNKNRSSGGGGFGASKENPLTHTPDTSETTQRLLQFLKAQKAKGLDDVEIGYSQTSGLRGLFATKNFKKGQYMCQIPSDCALALSDPEKNGEDAPTLAHNGANFLSMYWNHEQNKQLWSPYLDTLPTPNNAKQFSPTPDYFSEDELQLLEFPRLIRQAKERKATIETVAKENGIEFDQLQFATWLVASRTFSISISVGGSSSNKDESSDNNNDIQYDERGQVIVKAGEPKQSIRVLVPFIDMANHNSDQPNAKLTLIDPEKDEAWFALEATRPIKAGKEITIAYGGGIESSAEILLNYGFVPTSNKIDEFMLQKGGEECITNLDGWTTTLEEDQTMLQMMTSDEDNNETLKKILQFRIRLKESYTTTKEE